jgi:hypothetical protein
MLHRGHVSTYFVTNISITEESSRGHAQSGLLCLYHILLTFFKRENFITFKVIKLS